MGVLPQELPEQPLLESFEVAFRRASIRYRGRSTPCGRRELSWRPLVFRCVHNCLWLCRRSPALPEGQKKPAIDWQPRVFWKIVLSLPQTVPPTLPDGPAPRCQMDIRPWAHSEHGPLLIVTVVFMFFADE